MAVEASEALSALLERQGFVALDGGQATLLEAWGYDLADALWSSRLLIDEPAAIVRCHREFLKHGADVITTCTYQGSLPGLRARGLDAAEARRCLRRAVELAHEARDTAADVASHNDSPLVLLSLGPYGAYLADGSEYTGAYDVTRAELEDFHAERMEILQQDGESDGLLWAETIPNAQEVDVLLELGRSMGRTLALSLSCADRTALVDGTPLHEVGERVAASRQVVALGVNCGTPTAVARQLEALSAGLAKGCSGSARSAVDLPHLSCAPNSGEVYTAADGSWSGEARSGVAAADDWIDAGARLVGGCCRVLPEEIGRLRSVLERRLGS